VYTPPPWRAGIGSEGWTPPILPEAGKSASANSVNPANAMKRRRKSFGADAPEVVTIDQIRPDWEAKLAAVQATVARRANRRIVMRQVGDRLIPVGITSGRVHAISTDEGQGEQGEGNGERERGNSRRSRRRPQNQELNQYLGQMGLGGQDLEELMIMEAMRLSLIEHEDQQKKQREEEEKKKRDAGGSSQPGAAGTNDAGPSAPEASPNSATSTAGSTSTTSPTLLSPNPPDSAFVTRPAHRSSFSLSGTAQNQSGGGRRSPSPMGALEAAFKSATFTATALTSPPPDSPEIELPSSSSQSSIPQIVHPDIAAQNVATTSSSGSVATPAGDSSAQLTAPAPPPNVRSASFASSVVSDETQNETTHRFVNDNKPFGSLQ